MKLTPGGNTALPHAVVRLTAGSGVDLTALVLTDGKVVSDADMVFCNQPSAPGVRWSPDGVEVDLRALRPGATAVVLLASPAAEGTTFGAHGPVTVTADREPENVSFTTGQLSGETALVLAELYIRQGVHKMRAVGQGYDSGLAGVATDFGIEIQVSSPAVTAASVSLTTGEQRLPIDMRKRLNLRKQQVAVVLTTHRLTGLQCRVILVLDVSGSTHRLYKDGVFSRAVERVAPIAALVDDGAEMQAFAMGSRAHRLQDVTIGDLPAWLAGHTAERYRQAGGANNEVAVMAAVREYVRAEPLEIPSLVLFFHDGGVTDSRGVSRAVREAVEDPIFWQFVGLGSAGFGILEKLDTLQDRRIDNTGFFALPDIDALADEDLYALLLKEFPDWLRAYYRADHPARASLS